MKSILHRIVMLFCIMAAFTFAAGIILYGKGSWNPEIMSWYKIQTPNIVILSLGVTFAILLTTIFLAIMLSKFDKIEVKIKTLSRVEIQDLIIIVINGMIFTKTPIKWENCNLNDIHLMKVQGFFFQVIDYYIYIDDSIEEIKSEELQQLEVEEEKYAEGPS